MKADTMALKLRRALVNKCLKGIEQGKLQYEEEMKQARIAIGEENFDEEAFLEQAGSALHISFVQETMQELGKAKTVRALVDVAYARMGIETYDPQDQVLFFLDFFLDDWNNK